MMSSCEVIMDKKTENELNYLLNKLRKNTSGFYMFNNSLSLLKKQEIDYLINNLESYKNKLSSSKN